MTRFLISRILSPVKPVRFSDHVLANLTDHDIDRGEVEKTLAEPEAIEPGHEGEQVYMRRYHDTVLDQQMLLRVIIEESDSEIVVVTVYKTSQIGRYLKEGRT